MKRRFLAIVLVCGSIAACSEGPDTTSGKPITAEAEAVYQKKLAAQKAARVATFAQDRKAIIANIQALSRAGKWDEARAAANEYLDDVNDAELTRLFKVADDKVSAQTAATAKAAGAAARATARKEGVAIGMSKEAVLGSSWGRPERVNRTASVSGDREQWVYGNGHYLYFQGNILTSIQTSR